MFKMRAHLTRGSPPPCDHQAQVQKQDEEEDDSEQCNDRTQTDCSYVNLEVSLWSCASVMVSNYKTFFT